jgi:signal transduction histidine kinase/predicted negative regulator of RcsB-dependent stress response
MKKFYCFCNPILLLFILLGFSSQAQQKAIDSTLDIVNKHPLEDSFRLDALIHLSWLYQTSNLGSSEDYAKKALALSDKLNDDSLTCASLSQLGSVYTWERKTTEALSIYFRLQETAKKINSSRWLRAAYLGIGYVYEMENEWGKALSYTLQALPIAENSPDPYDEAGVYNHLGAEYLGLHNDQTAEEYLRKAAALYKKDNNLDQLGDCEISLAKVFVNRKNYDSAKYYFNSAINLFASLDEPYQIADVYQHMGDMFVARGLYEQAKDAYNKTILMLNKNDVSEADYALAVIGLGTVAWAEKKYDSASKIFHTEFEKVKAAGIIEPQLQCLAYMSRVDSALGNYKEALEHMQSYMQLYENFYSEEKTKATQRMLVEFDVQSKEKENEQLKEKNNLQHDRMVIFVVSIIALVIAATMLALLYKQKTDALSSVKELQQKTEEKHKELEVIDAVKDKLISMIAHDVRSPLTSLQNTLYLTREKILSEEEFRDLSFILDSDIRHVISMLDNTLLWAREQIQAIQVNKAPFDLHEVTEDVIALYHQSIFDKKLEVKNHVQPSTVVNSDKEIIHTALRNLLSNAIKFTPSGTCIELNAMRSNGSWMVTVKDEGVGMSSDVLEKISRKEFVSTRGTNNEKGTGLGLMFSNDLLAKLGEKLYIESEIGKGTAITFSIKANEAHAS